MKNVLTDLLFISYNLTILGTTTYLVFSQDRSGWWYVLAVCLLMEKKG